MQVTILLGIYDSMSTRIFLFGFFHWQGSNHLAKKQTSALCMQASIWSFSNQQREIASSGVQFIAP